MRKLLFLSVLLIIGAGIFTSVFGQADVGIQAKFAGGEVVSVSDSKIVLKTKDGEIEVVLSESTAYKRVPPENPTLKAAVDSNFSEIGTGDKLLVTGTVGEDKKSVPAKTIYLITKSDIAQRQAKESQEWKTRGIAGKVVSVDPLNKEITISTRSIVGETKTVISPKEEVHYKRYAQDSIKFSEATESTLGAINPGDMIRALGDRGESNTFKAELIVTGAFQTTAGTILSVDPEKNEVTVNDIQTKKPVTVVISQTSIVKEFPAEMAQRLAMMQMMRASGAQPPQGGGQRQGGDRPPQENAGSGQQSGQGRPGMGGGMRGGSIDDMLERFPNITVADLKVGEMIAVSSSKTANPERITAIKLLSGVEPFLKVPQMTAGRGGRGGQSGGQDSGFNIPGLDDGFGVP
ncbi:MAG: hypothetical protein R2747_02840 [Pyrinomonadaceae bacterium]